MAQHLVMVALGPVQDFIAQARRTRDLWFGSALLSELSGAAAKALQGGGARLVFPATLDQPGIANKIVATVDERSDDAVATLVTDARKAALDAWREKARRTKNECAGLIRQGPGADALWEEQVESFLEFNAVWCDVGVAGGYAAALHELDRSLAARKGLREFARWETQLPGLPKSSLDGVRQTVLREAGERDAVQVRKLRIDRREQLDAVGLIKRAQPQPSGGFAPISNVALGPWIEVAVGSAPKEVATLDALCHHHDLSRVGQAGVSFEWEAQVFMRDRWAAIARERYPKAPDGDDAAGKALQYELRDRAGAVLRKGKMRDPHPYVACIMADGDRMGACLRELGDEKHHREFSAKLTSFAVEARKAVEGAGGSLVYAGGDDVLAFVSVSKALACAAELQRVFARVMQEALRDRPEVKRPTLSVGIGIGHVLESMGQLRELGRLAEKLAKSAALPAEHARRDALAVVVDKRSGGTVAWRAKWQPDPVARLDEDVKLLGARLPLGKVFEVKRLLQRLPRPAALASESDARRLDFLHVLDLEVRRILARAGKGTDRDEEPEDALTPEAAGLTLGGADYGAAFAAVDAWVARVLVATMFYEAQQALEPTGRAS